MRLPFSSEPEAFRFALGLAFAVGVSVLVGSVLGPVAGIVLFALIALAAVLWHVWGRESGISALGAAELAGHERGARDRRRVLVVANEALPAHAPPHEIVDPRDPRPALEVVAPVLQSKSHFVTTDMDRETEEARHRLRQTLAWASGHGIEATGEVGDPVDPLAGLEDELRRYDIDEVIFTTHTPERANWLEARTLERARSELGIPVRHLVIDGERVVADEARPQTA